YYFYLDSTPTHSFMRYLYKYPQRPFPYADLVQTNRSRSRFEMEYELLDTGIFDDDRYFDVFVTYAKASPDDILIEIGICNRGPEAAEIHVLPTLWFRNTWASEEGITKPLMKVVGRAGSTAIVAVHPTLGGYYLRAEETAPLLFTENETNCERVF